MLHSLSCLSLTADAWRETQPAGCSNMQIDQPFHTLSCGGMWFCLCEHGWKLKTDLDWWLNLMVVPSDIYRADIPPPLSKISAVSAIGVCVCFSEVCTYGSVPCPWRLLTTLLCYNISPALCWFYSFSRMHRLLQRLLHWMFDRKLTTLITDYLFKVKIPASQTWWSLPFSVSYYFKVKYFGLQTVGRTNEVMWWCPLGFWGILMAIFVVTAWQRWILCWSPPWSSHFCFLVECLENYRMSCKTLHFTSSAIIRTTMCFVQYFILWPNPCKTKDIPASAILLWLALISKC